MKDYYVDRTVLAASGRRQVHEAGCPHLPSPEELIPLGSFLSSQPAIMRAQLVFPLAAGCDHCCPQYRPRRAADG